MLLLLLLGSGSRWSRAFDSAELLLFTTFTLTENDNEKEIQFALAQNDDESEDENFGNFIRSMVMPALRGEILNESWRRRGAKNRTGRQKELLI